MSEEEVKAILEAIKPASEHVTEAVRHITAAMGEMVQPVIDGIAAILDADRAIMAAATPKERHYILHGKKWRVRKKYYDRARRRMLARAGLEVVPGSVKVTLKGDTHESSEAERNPGQASALDS